MSTACEICGSQEPMKFCLGHSTDAVETEQCLRLLLTETERDRLKALSAELVAALMDCSDRLEAAYKQEPQVAKDIGITKTVRKARAILAKGETT